MIWVIAAAVALVALIIAAWRWGYADPPPEDFDRDGG